MRTTAGHTTGSGSASLAVRISHGTYTPTRARHDHREHQVPQCQAHRNHLPWTAEYEHMNNCHANYGAVNMRQIARLLEDLGTSPAGGG